MYEHTNTCVHMHMMPCLFMCMYHDIEFGCILLLIKAEEESKILRTHLKNGDVLKFVEFETSMP